ARGWGTEWGPRAPRRGGRGGAPGCGGGAGGGRAGRSPGEGRWAAPPPPSRSAGVVRSTSATRPSRQRTAESPTAVSTQVVGCVVVVGGATGTVVVEAFWPGIVVVVISVLDVIADVGVAVEVVVDVVDVVRVVVDVDAVAPISYAPRSTTLEPLPSPSAGRAPPVMSTAAACALSPESIAGDPARNLKSCASALLNIGSAKSVSELHPPGTARRYCSSVTSRLLPYAMILA